MEDPDWEMLPHRHQSHFRWCRGWYVHQCWSLSTISQPQWYWNVSSTNVGLFHVPCSLQIKMHQLSGLTQNCNSLEYKTWLPLFRVFGHYDAMSLMGHIIGLGVEAPSWRWFQTLWVNICASCCCFQGLLQLSGIPCQLQHAIIKR